MNIVNGYCIWINRLNEPKNVWKQILDISYSISTQTVPLFTMGDTDPSFFRRGREAIAGTFTLLVDDKKDLRKMIDTIEKYGIEYKPRIPMHENWNNPLYPNNLYKFVGVDILNQDTALKSYEDDSWANLCTFTFVAKRVEIQKLS